jgi:hypothetical protein
MFEHIDDLSIGIRFVIGRPTEGLLERADEAGAILLVVL